jgi:hypothetical protein
MDISSHNSSSRCCQRNLTYKSNRLCHHSQRPHHSATETFATQFPLQTSVKARNNRLSGRTGTLLSLLSENEPAQWDTSAIYLQIKADGFIGPYGGTGTAKKAERILRAILGLGLANRLFDFELRYSPTPLKSRAYVHKQLPDGKWEAITRYDLDDSISRGINGLKFAEFSHVDTDVKKAAWRFYRTQEIGIVLQSGLQAEQTVLSAQWLFDSYCSQDQLLCFIQSMVVLEILFGDKRVSDEVGIGELISSRFAYLVGTTHEERADHIEALRKIYRVRSQIVHSGNHRLTLEERGLFSRLRWMCRRAIDKEIDLLKAAVEKKKPTLENKSAS